jgi:hypothetical protein
VMPSSVWCAWPRADAAEQPLDRLGLIPHRRERADQFELAFALAARRRPGLGSAGTALGFARGWEEKRRAACGGRYLARATRSSGMRGTSAGPSSRSRLCRPSPHADPLALEARASADSRSTTVWRRCCFRPAIPRAATRCTTRSVDR